MTGHIEKAWRSYLHQVVPRGAPPVQVRETKRAFFAGASAYAFTVMSLVSKGAGVTAADESMMKDIMQELEDFTESVGKGQQ